MITARTGSKRPGLTPGWCSQFTGWVTSDLYKQECEDSAHGLVSLACATRCAIQLHKDCIGEYTEVRLSSILNLENPDLNFIVYKWQKLTSVRFWKAYMWGGRKRKQWWAKSGVWQHLQNAVSSGQPTLSIVTPKADTENKYNPGWWDRLPQN